MVIDANLVTAHLAGMANAVEKLLNPGTLSEMRSDRIGYRMKLLRLALGFRPAEISDHLGIERTYWSRTENGGRALPDTLAALIVERFGVTLDFLILGKWDKLPVDLAMKMKQVERDIADQGSPQ